MQNVLADKAVSVSELKKNSSTVIGSAQDGPVAVLNHNRVMGYMVPAAVFEVMIERLEDLELAELVRARANERPVPMSLDDL
ncbi:type II toxin-antitoxin system Phd/YefM family antitoxin [Azorhizophilus paspali]|uniref:Antitoxin n=1 Tax=Azorhizophilus paspali TaxID=69963 RepID=A0ABV6SJQ3_AZOPA